MWRAIQDLYRLSGAGGWTYESAHYLAADLEIDREAARALLPCPLRPGRVAVATFFLARFDRTSFGSVYREAGIFLHARHGRRRVVFCPWMIVDDDVALIVGRELLGYPKKMGRIELELGEREVRGEASRKGAHLLSMAGRLGAEIERPPPIIGQPHRNVRAALGLAAPALVAFTPEERVVSVREAELTLRFGGSERDPIAALGPGKHLGARLHHVRIRPGRPPVPVGFVSPLYALRHFRARHY